MDLECLNESVKWSREQDNLFGGGGDHDRRVCSILFHGAFGVTGINKGNGKGQQCRRGRGRGRGHGGRETGAVQCVSSMG